MSEEKVRQSIVTKNTLVSWGVVVMLITAAFGMGSTYMQVSQLSESIKEMRVEIKDIKDFAGTRIYLDYDGTVDFCRGLINNT